MEQHIRLNSSQRRLEGKKGTKIGAWLLLCVAAMASTRGVVSDVGPSVPCWLTPSNAGRRGALAAALGAAWAVGAESPVEAFPNAIKIIKRAANDAKKKGPQAEDLGLSVRFDSEGVPALKECTEKTPNCFSTTGNPVLDSQFHLIEPWKFKGKSPQTAYAELVDVVTAYPPGQKGIDGGGFQIVAQEQNCIYIQYENLKQGHLDDVEFCLEPGTNPEGDSGNVLVRSASRQGFWDYGVNAIRLNRLADDIRKKGGWTAQPITAKSHPIYWRTNCDGGDGRKAPYVVRDVFPEYCAE